MSEGPGDGWRVRLASRAAALRRLPWTDRWLLLQAIALISGARLAVRLLGVRRAFAANGRIGPPAGRRMAETAGASDRTLAAAGRAVEVARLVDAASRHLPVESTCLHRSLALWWLLQRRGIDCDLHLGVRRRDGRLEAHAWVQHGETVLNDDRGASHGYMPLDWMPAEHDA